MARKLVLLALAVVAASSTTGCWSRKEITEIAIVLGAGVDLTPEGQVRLTLQIARSGCAAAGAESTGAMGQAASWVISSEGRTIEEAERHLAERVPREIYWGHCIVLVLGKQLAQQGANLVTDFFARDREPRETMWVMVADGEAKQVLETCSSLEKTSAQAAGFLMRLGTAYPVQFREFIEMLTSEGMQPVLPRVTVSPPGFTPGKTKGDEAGAESEIKISGSAAFKGDVMVGWLDQPETQGLLWLKGEMAGNVITVPGISEPDRYISLRVRNSQVKVIPFWDGTKPAFDVRVELEADMLEQQCLEEMSTPDKIRKLEKLISSEVESNIRRVLDKAQTQFQLDIFGFGCAFHRRFKREWRAVKQEWDHQFSRCLVNVTVQAHVREIGLLTRRTYIPK